MNASDEERCLLDDESMDEMFELEEALQTRLSDESVLTRADRDEGNGSDDDDDDDRVTQQDSDSSIGADSDSSHDEDSDEETRRITTRRSVGDAHDSDNASSDAEDEPPEIPGSPLRSSSPEVPATINRDSGLMNRLSDVDIGRCGELTRQRKEREKGSVEILRISPRENEDEEYEIRDSEQPRAMEFHSSSSSSEDDEDGQNDSDDEDNQRHGRASAFTGPPQPTARPKTAASELAQYRDVLPPDFYEQNGPTTQQQQPAPSTRAEQAISNRSNVSSQDTFVVRVPQEIQALFRHIDEYKPEELDLPTRLEPFIPDFVPTIGIPFDGIQVPRPDGKPDDTGICVLREPTVQSNTAELELLLRATAKRKRQRDTRSAVVHGIEDAAHRPREIDRWIAGVAKVQATQPPAQVIYKKPMPTLLSLMEFWPESISEFLSVTPLVAVDKMDLTLEETIDVVCGVLDIPVYPQQRLHSLHVLFCLYHEIVMYEKEMASTVQAPSRPP